MMRRSWLAVLAMTVAACAGPGSDPPPKANPAMLVGTTWTWAGGVDNDGQRIDVPDPTRLTLSFQTGGRVNIRADCNRGSAGYFADPTRLEIGAVALTKMLCGPGAQDREFLRGLETAGGWRIKDGELIVTAKQGGGTMRFTPLAR